MPQQTSPFLEAKWGWSLGEDNWNTGMDENLLKFSFLFDKNVDAIVGSLPAAVNGESYFLTTDSRLYFAIGNTFYSAPTPKWLTFQIRGTGQTWQFNGTSAVQIDSPAQIDSRLDAVELTISSLGTAAFEDVTDLVTKTELADTVSQTAGGLGLIGRATRQVTDIVELKTVSGRFQDDLISVLGYYSSTPGQGGGLFRWEASSVLAEDQGTVFQVTGVPTGRWFRVHSRIEPSMFGAVPIAGTDRTAALQAMRDYLAAQLLPSGCVFTAGVYQYTISPNWAIADIQIKTEGEVRLRYTGVGNAVILDAGAGAQTVFNVQMGDFIVECPGTAQNGVYVRSVHESRLGFNVPTAGATFAGIRVEFAVLTTFVRPTVSSNVVSFYGAAPPQYGVFLTRRGVGEQTSYCRFEGISCAGSSIGLHLDHTLGNIFLGGALQGSTSRGMETTANALRDKFFGLDFEANATRDIVCLGRQLEFHACDTTLSVFLAGSFNRLVGGNHETVEVDASAQSTLLSGFLYRRNDTGSLIDNSTSTRMADLTRVDVGGATFRKHNAVPSRNVITVTASPFTFQNTTGNDMTVFLSGGTVSMVTLIRDGVGTTVVAPSPAAAVGVPVHLSPTDSVQITYTVAPAAIRLSR